MIVVHESHVCPEQLNCLLFFRKILQVPQILWFSSIFVYLNPFQQWLYDFEIHLFHTEDNWGTHMQLLQKVQTLTDWCSRRKKHTLRAGEWKLFEFEDQGKFNSFCLLGNKTIFCSLWRAVLNEKIWYLSKIRKMYTSPFCSKVFTPSS